MNSKFITYIFQSAGAFIGAYGYDVIRLIVNGTPIKWLESFIVATVVCIGFGIYDIIMARRARLTKPKD